LFQIYSHSINSNSFVKQKTYSGFLNAKYLNST
jgi:hypothetical protein